MAKETVLRGTIRLEEVVLNESLSNRILSIAADGTITDRPAIDASTLLAASLAEQSIFVGDTSSLAVAVATDNVGDILADAVNGLTIKAGSITNSHIDSAAGIVYSKLDLTDGIVDNDVSGAAGIGYAKLNLTLSIIDNDISATAGITRTKLATGTPYRVVSNNSLGVLAENPAITPNRAIVSNVNGQPIAATTTDTQIEYLANVDSDVQSQLDNEITTKPVNDLVKNPTTSEDGYAITWNEAAGEYTLIDPVTQGIPSGGSARQFLGKNSGTDYDVSYLNLVLTDVTDITAVAADLNLLAMADSEGLIATEILTLIGVTSSIQDQLDSKQSNILPANSIWIGNSSNLATPLAASTNGYVLTMSAGVPSWQPVSAGTPPGSDTQIIFNDGGTLGADADLTYNKTTNTLTVVNLGTATTIGSAYIYRVSGTDVALADGGTGASLTDPNADRVLFWDDSAGAVTWLTMGTNLSITGTTLNASLGAGAVTGAGSSTDNAITRWDGATGTSVQNSTVIVSDTGTISAIENLTVLTGGALRTNTSAGNTLLLQAYDVNGASYTTFGTLTANDTPTFDLSTAVTIGGAVIYRVGGTDVALADGGTGASLSDPNADRIMFWDESAGAVTWLTVGTGLTITTTTLSNDLASVGLSVGTAGTDVNVSGSPLTSSGTITLNIPSASLTARGLISTSSQDVVGLKTLNVTTSATNTAIATARLNLISSGDMVDGFAPIFDFRIQDDAGVSNRLGYIGFERAGADDTGDFFIAPATAGTGSVKVSVTSGGNVGIGTETPHAPLQFANGFAARKIVLSETADNDHQVYGFGRESGFMRYQIGAAGAAHKFYAAASSSASTEIFTINGSGVIQIPVTPTTDNTNTDILTRDSSGNVEIRTVASLGIPSLTSTQVAFGSGTNTVTSDANFTFNSTTDTLTVSNLILSSVPTTANSNTDVLTRDSNGNIEIKTDVIDGTGSVTQVAVFADGNTIQSTSGLTFNVSTKVLTLFDSGAGSLVLNGNSSLEGDFSGIPIVSAQDIMIHSTGGRVAIAMVTNEQASIHGLTSGGSIPINVLRLDTNTASAVSAGYGVGLEFSAETSTDNEETGASVQAIVTDTTLASEDFNLVFNIMVNGSTTLVEKGRFTSSGLTVTGEGTATDWVATSDRRLKSNIQKVDEDVITEIKRIGSLFSRYERAGKKERGFIAQELLEVAPEYVVVPENKEDMMAINYSKMTALLFKGFEQLLENGTSK